MSIPFREKRPARDPRAGSPPEEVPAPGDDGRRDQKRHGRGDGDRHVSRALRPDREEETGADDEPEDATEDGAILASPGIGKLAADEFVVWVRHRRSPESRG